MRHRWLSTAAFTCLLGSSLLAADAAVTEPVPASVLIATSETATHIASLPPSSTEARGEQQRPVSLLPMYIGFAALQSYDMYSTLTALRAGAHEANPVASGLVSTPAVFAAAKIGGTAAAFYASEHLWRNHRRGAAIAVMVGSNIAMSLVSANNARVLARTN
jgi:hypothetical protein